jgi:hypothetical protein
LDTKSKASQMPAPIEHDGQYVSVLRDLGDEVECAVSKSRVYIRGDVANEARPRGGLLWTPNTTPPTSTERPVTS